MSNIDSMEDDLDIKFALTKNELDKELQLKKEIVDNRKEHLIKKLLEKGDQGLKLKHKVLKQKRKLIDRNLHFKSVSLDMPEKKAVTLGINSGKIDIRPIRTQNVLKNINQNESSINNVENNSNDLLSNLEYQAKSINSIMKALQGLSDSVSYTHLTLPRICSV